MDKRKRSVSSKSPRGRGLFDDVKRRQRRAEGPKRGGFRR